MQKFFKCVAGFFHANHSNQSVTFTTEPFTFSSFKMAAKLSATPGNLGIVSLDIFIIAYSLCIFLAN